MWRGVSPEEFLAVTAEPDARRVAAAETRPDWAAVWRAVMVPGGGGGAVRNKDVNKGILPESAARRREVVSDILGVVRMDRRGSMVDICWSMDEAADCMKEASSSGPEDKPLPLPLLSTLRRAVFGRRDGISARALGGSDSS